MSFQKSRLSSNIRMLLIFYDDDDDNYVVISKTFLLTASVDKQRNYIGSKSIKNTKKAA